jgi:hypothetical protein
MKQILQSMIVCALLFLPFAAAGRAQSCKAALQGTVRHARTGEPIVGARITLLSTVPSTPPTYGGTEPPLATATTDPNGEFVLRGLDAGSYRLSAGNNGFVRHDQTGILLTDGQVMKDISVRLVPTASISGRVVKTSGRPIAGLTVTLMRRTYSTNGTIGIATVATAQTNDRGEYRTYWVNPGRYYVMVAGRSTLGALGNARSDFESGISRGTNDVPENYAQTYFPGVADVSQASLVELQEGAELRGVDFVLARQGYSIRGRIIDGSTGQSPAKASIPAAIT